MSKEIIINDVNVAECRHLSFVEEDYCCDCQYEKYALCQNSDCYYKQLKRLQSENEELKHRCEVYHQCDEMIKNTYGQAHKKAMELTKENELIKRLLNDILRIFNLGQYDFLKDQNEIIMALEKAVQKDKDFFEFVELKQENKRLKSELKSQQMINLKQQDIAQDYWNALEEIKEIASAIINGKHIINDIEGHLKELSKQIIEKINEVLDER